MHHGDVPFPEYLGVEDATIISIYSCKDETNCTTVTYPSNPGETIQSLEYQRDVRRCRFDIINLAHCSRPYIADTSALAI